jgi:hypothetical protein
VITGLGPSRGISFLPALATTAIIAVIGSRATPEMTGE